MWLVLLPKVYFGMTSDLGNTKSDLSTRPTELFSLGKAASLYVLMSSGVIIDVRRCDLQLGTFCLCNIGTIQYC